MNVLVALRATASLYFMNPGYFLSSDMICFCLQALYFCVPFREQLLEYYSNNKNPGEADENILTCLAELFSQVVHLE